MSPVVSQKGWAERIRLAIKRGYFTKQDVKLASSWQTCAIGERVFAETKKRARTDTCENHFTKAADNAGMAFMDAVMTSEDLRTEPPLARAAKIFQRIQKLKHTQRG